MPERARRAAAAALAALVLAAVGCGREPALVVLRGETMGTRWSVKALAPPGTPPPEALDAAIRARLDELNAALSNWAADSELSRLSRDAAADWTPVSEDLFAVLRAAAEVSRWSDGAFDVTVAPLVELWGFGPAGPREAPPAEEELAAARARTGAELLELRDDPPAVRKRRADVAIDLSAIAVGHAVDRLAELLEQRGVERYLVDIGGELRARGAGPEGGPWRIAVQRPDAPEGRAQRVVPLADRAIATSGDYRRFFERDGRRYAHVLDPRTGAPVRHALASVTVLASTAAEADAAATALLVLGPEAGWRAAQERGLAAAFVVRGEDGRLEERVTPAFAALVAGPAPAAGADEGRAAAPWLTWLLAAGVFALAAAGLAAGALAGRGPLRRSCSPEACGACVRPCRRRLHETAP